MVVKTKLRPQFVTNHISTNKCVKTPYLGDVLGIVALLVELLEPHSYREGDLRETDTLRQLGDVVQEQFIRQVEYSVLVRLRLLVTSSNLGGALFCDMVR